MDLPISADTLVRVTTNTSVGLAVFNASDLRFLWANAAFRKMVRTKAIPPEFPEVGMTLRDLVAPTYRPVFDELIGLASELPVAYDFERPFRRTRDTTFPAEFWLRKVSEEPAGDEYLVLEIVDMSFQKLFEEVTEKRMQLQRVLTSISDALVVVGQELRISGTYSEEARRLFGQPSLADVPLCDVVFPHRDTDVVAKGEWARMETFLSTAFALLVPEQYPAVEESLAPRLIHCPRGRLFAVHYSPVLQDDAICSMILVLQDQTELFRLKESVHAVEHQSAAHAIQSLARQVSLKRGELTRFLEDVLPLLSHLDEICETHDRQGTEDLLRVLHTVKGNARMFDLRALEAFAHEAESALFSAVSETSEYQAALYWKDFSRFAQEVVRTLESLSRLLREDSDDHEQSWESFLEARKDMVARVATELGKEAVLEGRAFGVRPRGRDLGVLGLVLLHLTRNSLDHGIEGVAQRLAAGKRRTGRIEFELRFKDQCFSVTFGDDGQGIAVDRILEKAHRLDMVSKTTNHLSLPELTDLLCKPGFSSFDAATMVSGRGVGLDSVRRSIEQHGGSVTIQSTGPDGTTFVVSWRAVEEYSSVTGPDPS